MDTDGLKTVRNWLGVIAVAYILYQLMGRSLLWAMNKIWFAVVMWLGAKHLARVYGKRKSELFEPLHLMAKKLDPEALNILEIGAGEGVNFEHFPNGCNVTSVEPNPYFDWYFQPKKKVFPHIIITDSVVARAEDLSMVPDESVDAVVCTTVLCSVDDVDMCLKEIRRVLKQGGKFFFLEHVRAPTNTWLCTLQRVVSVPWFWIFDGCNTSRETWRNIDAAGFSEVSQERFMAPVYQVLYPIKPHLIGVATK